MLHRHTGQTFTQTPGSGSGKIKGDLYVPHKHNIFTIEVKFYRDMAFNHKIFTQKSNKFVGWWSKLVKQAEQMKKNQSCFSKKTTLNGMWQRQESHFTKNICTLTG